MTLRTDQDERDLIARVALEAEEKRRAQEERENEIVLACLLWGLLALFVLLKDVPW